MSKISFLASCAALALLSGCAGSGVNNAPRAAATQNATPEQLIQTTLDYFQREQCDQNLTRLMGINQQALNFVGVKQPLADFQRDFCTHFLQKIHTMKNAHGEPLSAHVVATQPSAVPRAIMAIENAVEPYDARLVDYETVFSDGYRAPLQGTVIKTRSGFVVAPEISIK